MTIVILFSLCFPLLTLILTLTLILRPRMASPEGARALGDWEVVDTKAEAEVLVLGGHCTSPCYPS